MDASLDALLAHRAWVRALAHALAQPADADDLEQEAWLAALEHPPTGETPRAWLATVLRRGASNLRRTLARRTARESAAARPEATAAAADLVARAETHERVVRAVLALPEPYRSTILFRFFEGLSPSGIAQRTGTPVDTVKARLRRGLARLRGDLPEGRAWSAALLALALPRRFPAQSLPVAFGALAMTLKTKLAIAATVLVLAGSVVTYRALDRAPDHGRAAPRRAAPAHEALAPAAGGEPAPSDTDTPAPGAPSLPEERRDFLVRGTVRGAGWPVPAGTEVMHPIVPYAVGEADGERRLWPSSRSTGDARGRFEVRFPFLASEAPCEIDFGVYGLGFVRQERKLVVEPGGEYEVDFTLEPGVGIAGTVLGPGGRPVKGLAILVAASDMPPHGLVTAVTLDIDRYLVKSRHFARGETDEAGRFEIGGLVPGTYALYSHDPDWILEHDRLKAPASGVRVVAVPAHALVGTIRDARTRAAIPEAVVFVHVKTPNGSGSSKATAATDGKLWVVWKPQAPELENGFEATVVAQADGYCDAQRVVAFPPGTRRAPLDLAMEPVDAGRIIVALRLEVVDTRGRLVDLPLSVDLRGADDATLRLPPNEIRPENGIYELPVPTGRWTLRLRPSGGLGDDLVWSDTIDIDGDTHLRCTLPAFGVLRVRHVGGKAWILNAETSDGSRGYARQIEGEEAALVMAPGEWTVWREGAWEREADPVQVGLCKVVVADGVEALLNLE